MQTGRFIVASLLAVVFLGPIAAQTPQQRRQREDEKLAGVWRVVGVEVDGRTLAREEIPNLRLTFQKGQFKVQLGSEKPQEGTYQLDPGKSPKTIDIARTTGPDKGKKQRGIYELTGNNLKICACEEKNERPTTFDTQDKPGYTVLILRRIPEGR
jgi:uncharacterized protein (TIGR03067 family)